MAIGLQEQTPVVDKWLWFNELGYQPHEGQVELHNSDARFRVVVAGRRWGKSMSAAKEAEVMLLTPGTRGWVVSKTYDLARKVIREIEKDLIMGKPYSFKPSTYQKGGPIVITFPWGSTVEGKSAEHPESLLGEGLDWLIFDECAQCKLSVWEHYLRPTLTDREGWALFITTPNGYNWIYDLWKRGNDPEFPTWQSFKFPSWTNPMLSTDDIEEARRTTEHATFMQEYGADFTLAAGQVYQDFDESRHVIPASDMKTIIQDDWKRYRAVDFGYNDPFVMLWIAVDPADRVYVYDEYYRQHRTIPRHIRYLVKRGKKLNIEATDPRLWTKSYARNNYIPACDKAHTYYEWTVCDVSAKSQRMEMGEAGIPCFGFRQDIAEGLDKVREQLKTRDDGEPALYVSSRCVNTIKEFNLYSYPGWGANDDRVAGENPVDAHNHCMDALRYFMMAWRKGVGYSYVPKRR